MVHLTLLVGQLTGTQTRCLVNHQRGLNLEIASLAGLVEEELDQGTLQACALTHIDGESGTRDLDTQVKVNEVILLGQVPVRQCILGQIGHLATRLFYHVVLGGLALGDTAVGHVGNAQQDFGNLVLGSVEVVVNLLVGGLEAGHLGLDVLGLVAVALLHEGTNLCGHLIEYSGVVVALFLQCTALLVQFHDAHNGLASVKLLDGQAANHILRVLVDEL